jgi:serine/threonine-protein kinase RsbW/stage II sporulation protein AB (anti-sigma F factor)
MLRCEHTWPATPEHVRDARARVAELASRAGAPRALLDGVRIAVSEAVSNAVVHGYRGRVPGPVTVVAEAQDSSLRVIVRDDGWGLGPRTDSPGAGLGLPLIAEVAESVSVGTGQDGQGTVLSMTFVLPMALAG